MGKGWFGKFGKTGLGSLIKKGATGAWIWSKANPWKAGA